MSEIQTVHPLFDPAGYYRLATRESVWHDGGQRSVQEFFVSRAREELYRQWQTDIPAEPQPWGYGPEIDREMHEFLLGNTAHPLVQTARASRPQVAAMVSNADAVPTPALILVDLESPQGLGAVTPIRSPRDLFTGIGTAPGGRAIKRFEVNLRGLAARRTVLVLLLTDELLGQFAKLWSPRMPCDNQSQALAVIAASLDPIALSGRSSPEAQRRAYHLSCTLALAPGLEGETSDAGTFSAQVDLVRDCPALYFGTWLVACLGPAAA